MDLRIVYRGDNIGVDDLIIRFLEFLKYINNVSLVLIDGKIWVREDGVILVIFVSLRFKIEVK